VALSTTTALELLRRSSKVKNPGPGAASCALLRPGGLAARLERQA